MLVGKDPAYNLAHDRVRVWREDRGLEFSWEEAKSQLERDRRELHNKLWQVMAAASEGAGMDDPTDLYYTNLVKCGGETSSSTWAKRYRHCNPYFEDERSQVDPEYIVLFGAKVVGKEYDDGTLEDLHCDEYKRNGRTLIPFYHWAARQWLPYSGFEAYKERLRKRIEDAMRA